MHEMLKDLAPTMDYALFPKSISYQRQSDGKRVSTNEIAIQASKQKDLSPGKLRQAIAECWEKLTAISGGCLYGKSFIPFGKECGLDDSKMNYLIQQHNIFVNTTKQCIANNLTKINEIMEVELKNSNNNGMDDTEMTLREQFVDQLDAKGNSLFARMEKTKVPRSFRIPFHEQKSDVIDAFLLDIDTILEDLGQWSDSTAHFW
jgi:hypothetical protein